MISPIILPFRFAYITRIMKKLYVKAYKVNRKGHYIVWITGKRFCEFKRAKARDKFLSGANKFLSNSMFKVNKIYSVVHGKYRRDWFYFHTPDDSRKFEFCQLERLIKNNLDSVSHVLDNCFHKCQVDALSYDPFSDLFKCTSLLLECIEAIKDFNATKSNTVEVFDCACLIGDLMTIRSQLKKYGFVEQTEANITTTQLNLLFKETANVL